MWVDSAGVKPAIVLYVVHIVETIVSEWLGLK